MLNGLLDHLPEGGEQEFSFTRQGLSYKILDALVERYRNEGWEAYAYKEDYDTGIVVAWPKGS
jgi:hypothetical protein